ncbi:hypothetical protein C0991_004841 [Blastosporella zonata]|nr:hypothetical protein C0991_004841 [Blastosporella zonata]
MAVSTTVDPLDEALRPPPDESLEEREKRLAREEEANRVSQAIDASIKAEKQARKKKRIVRLLLLGQSESGKSTTLRQFQRLYTPTAFREERILWRAVIQLNIVRSIRIILETLTSPAPKSPRSSPFSSPRSRARSISRPPAPIPPLPPATGEYPPAQWNGNGNGNGTFATDVGEESDPDSDSDMMSHPRSNPSSSITLFPSPLEALKTRLQPLRHIEALLIAKLVPPNEDEATHLAGPLPSTHPLAPANPAAFYPSPSSSPPSGAPIQTHTHTPSSYKNQEIFVRPGAGWKGALSKARLTHSQSPSSDEEGGRRPTSAGNTGLETPDEPQEVLYQCRKDMMLLWGDDVVREILMRKKVRLEELPGFFLNDLERVTSLRYMPTDDDVLKARLKTVGVSEYKFEMEVSAGRDSGTEWRIVDVGGSRSQRLEFFLLLSRLARTTEINFYSATWAPFFDDVDAIIFLAPISGFDQVLAEDRSVNRLEDSVLLWKAVCSNKLLANVDIVLFLNKCDILDAKLQAGVRYASSSSAKYCDSTDAHELKAGEIH